MSDSRGVLVLAWVLATAAHAAEVDSKSHSNDSKRTSAAAQIDCSAKGFLAEHGTVSPALAIEASHTEAHNATVFRLSGKKPATVVPPRPLLGVSQTFYSVTHYNPTYGVPGAIGEYDTQHPLGFQVALGKNSDVRVIAAKASLCHQSGNAAYFDQIEKVLLEAKSRLGMRKNLSGEEEKKTVGDDEKAHLELLIQMMGELRELSKKSEPAKDELLREIMAQVLANDKSIQAKKPLELTPGFKAQLAKYSALYRKDAVTAEEQALMKMFDEVTAEPRFSFLIHPLVSKLVSDSLRNGFHDSGNRSISQGQLDDIALQLGSKLGDRKLNLNAYLDPSHSQGSIVGGQFNSGSFTGPLDEAVQGFLKTGIDLPLKEQVARSQEMQRRLLATLNDYDSLKHGSSPQLNGLRGAILHAVRQLSSKENGTETTESVGRLSERTPEVTGIDLSRLHTASEAQGMKFDPAAVASLSTYDPLTKRLVDTLSGFSAKNAAKKTDVYLAQFLQTGHSTDLMRVFHNSPTAFRGAVAELKKSGADPYAIYLLGELAESKYMNEGFQKAYRTLRTRLVGELLSKPFSELDEKGKANLLALSLLDEVGLHGVTPRDDEETSNPNYYQPVNIYQEFVSERKAIEEAAKRAGMPPSEFEALLFTHANQFTGRHMGLTPEVRRTLAQRIAPDDSEVHEGELPAGLQMELLNFAHGLMKGDHRSAESKQRARENMEKIVFRPIHKVVAEDLMAGQAGSEALSFSLPSEALFDADAEALESLANQGFLDAGKLDQLTQDYFAHEKRVNPTRDRLKSLLLDRARNAFTELSRLSDANPKDQGYARRSAAMNLLVEKILEPLFHVPGFDEQIPIDDLIMALDEPMAKGPHFNYAVRRMAGAISNPVLGPNEKVIELLQEAFTELKNDQGGVIAALDKAGDDALAKLSAANTDWKKLLETRLPNATDEELWVAQKTIKELALYQRGIEGVERARLRSPDALAIRGWRENLEQEYDRRIADGISQVLGGENERHAQEALPELRKRLEQHAIKKAAQDHAKASAALAELTDPKGKFAAAKIQYDPIFNQVVLGKDTLLYQRAMEKLEEVGDFNTYIEPSKTELYYHGMKGLKDWMQKRRYEMGVSGTSVKGHEEADTIIPLTDRSSVRMSRYADGTYKYAYQDSNLVRDTLERDKKALAEAQNRYTKATEDAASWYHASKLYFGGLARVDVNNTTEVQQLDKSYAELRGALQKVGMGGLVDDVHGTTARQIRMDAEARTGEKVRNDEVAAISKLNAQIDVIDTIAFTVATLPAAYILEAALVARLATLEIAAAEVAVGSARAANIARQMRAMQIALKAAQVYRISTTKGIKTALTFKALEEATKHGLMAFHPGEGPRMIREKLAAAYPGRYDAKGKEIPGWKPPEDGKLGTWRKHKAAPKVSDVFKNIDHPTPEELAKWAALNMEYRIEEALDPDSDGIPNNHSYWNQPVNDKETHGSLIHAPFASSGESFKFFQGLELFQQATGLHVLPLEMAFANLWSRFHPSDIWSPTDPLRLNFDRVKRLEAERVAAENKFARENGKPETAVENPVWRIALNEGRDGAIEGARFGVAGIPAKMVARALPGRAAFKSKLAGHLAETTSTVLGVGTFIAADELTKWGVEGLHNGGHWENPFQNPDHERIAHSLVMGGYIGKGIVQGAKQGSYHEALKEKYLGISRPGAKETGVPREVAERPLQKLIDEVHGGNEAEAMSFIASLRVEDLNRAPRKTQEDYFRIMSQQTQKGVNRLKEYADASTDPNLKRMAEQLAKIPLQQVELARKASEGTLSQQDMVQAELLRTTKESLLHSIHRATAKETAAYQKARAQLNRGRGTMFSRVTGKEVESLLKAAETVEKYEQKTGKLHEAAIRFGVVDNYQTPLATVAALTEPGGSLAKTLFGESHQAGLKALQREAERQQGSPLRQKIVKGVQKLEEERLVPHMTSHSENFSQAQKRVSKMILSARAQTKDPKEMAELLEMLRVTDPQAAYDIERKASDVLPY